MNRFENMQTFVKIVETGSQSATAEQMDIAVSAVSRRLKDLESHLGVELFHRTTRQMTLTDTGHAYYLRCVQILDDVLETEISVSKEHSELKGKLRIAMPSTFGTMHISPLLNEFLNIHPGVEFDLDFNDRAVDLVREGFDLALRISKLDDSSLIARKISEIKRVFCASPEYLQQRGEPTVPDELSNHRTIAYSFDHVRDTWILISDAGKEFTIKLNPYFRASSGEILRDAAVAGRGITFLPTFIVHRELEEGSLVPILRDYSTPEVNLFVIYPQTRHLCTRVRAFIDFISERFSGVPHWDAP